MFLLLFGVLGEGHPEFFLGGKSYVGQWHQQLFGTHPVNLFPYHLGPLFHRLSFIELFPADALSDMQGHRFSPLFEKFFCKKAHLEVDREADRFAEILDEVE
jgi:hypothetical protein